MFDERSPAMRRALAPYEDSIAGFSARLENRGAEFAAKLAECQRMAAERDARQLAALAAVLSEQKQEQERPRSAADTWPAGPDPSSSMDFGTEDEQAATHQPTTPIPVPAAEETTLTMGRDEEL